MAGCKPLWYFLPARPAAPAAIAPQGSPLTRRSQRLINIRHQVIDMLDANRQADHVDTDAGFGHFCRGQLAVGGAGRVAGERFGVADVDQAGDQLQRVDETPARFCPALDAEAEDAGGTAAHVVVDQRFVIAGFQPGITHPRHLRVLLQALGNRQGVVADAIHAQRQGFDALQDQKAVERADRRAHIAQRHHACAADVGGCPQCFGVNHAVIADIRLVEALEALLVLGPGDLPESTIAPPMLLPWPPRYLVSECTTMSAPCSNGRHR